jgi:hypothetical protein
MLELRLPAPWLSTERASGMRLHVTLEKPADVLQKCATFNTPSFKTLVHTIPHGVDVEFTNFPKHVEATFNFRASQG